MPESLVDLLPNHLSLLNDAVKKLLSCVEKGIPADFNTGDAETDKLENSDNWDESRTLRAEVIRWLSIDEQATKRVHARGVQVKGAKIAGKLDFAFTTLPHRLGLFSCVIDEGIVLLDASTRTLNFSGSRTGQISADGLKTRGSVFLRDGFHAKGEVRLLGADIGGDLDCRKGTFENEKGYALSADGLKTKGAVFLRDGFHAKGEVRLLGANIGGNLDCSNGRFKNENGNALNADGLKTKGSVFLNDGFHAEGEVRLLGADIGGDLVCSKGHFEKENGKALSADRLKTKGSVFLNDGFHAEGEVRLLGADIGGDLACRNGSFEKGTKKNGNALNADGLKTKGTVFLNGGFHAKGEVRLLGANIGGNLDCSNGRFENENGDALCAERMNVAGSFFWQTNVKPVGRIDLLYACVGQLVDNEKSWPEKGNLHIDGFVYGALVPDNTPKSAQERLDLPRLHPDKYFNPQPYEQLKKVLQKYKVLTPDDAKTYKERLDWLRKQPYKPFKPQPYEQLAKVLRAMGHEKDAHEVLIAKHQDLREYGTLDWNGKFWNWILDVTIGYGWKPWKAVLFFILPLLLLGWGIFCYADKNLHVMQPSKERVFMSEEFQKDGVIPAGYPVFNPFIYSIETFVPFVGLHQEDYWLPDANREWGTFFRWYLWGHIVLGWVLSTLAAVGLTGLVRKE